MTFNNKSQQITTKFPVRSIQFSGNLLSFDEELTCDILLKKFNEFVKQNKYLGGLNMIHDSLYDQTSYPTNYEPNYLYHYTNINTLALILEKRSIMLNNLSNVDDLNEGQTRDYGNLGQYCFASCWTELSEESIPFWNMYTNKMKGVRIRLKSNPFKMYTIDKIPPKINNGNIDIELPKNLIYPEDILFNDNFIPMPPYDNILEKVIYTDDPNILNYDIYKKFHDCERLELNKLGKYKRKEWEFQGEWRYVIRLLPTWISEISILGEKWFDVATDRLRDNYDIGRKNILLEIDEEVFKDMEVVLGPMTTEGDKLIVDALLKRYNSSATLKESVLKGQINVK